MSLFNVNLYDSVLYQPPGIKFKLTELKLPNNHDWFFTAKCDEIFDQYNFARMYLEKSKLDCQDYWFPKQQSEEVDEFATLYFQANLYETSLIYYNIVVDLSWALTKLSLEYYHYKFNDDGSIKEILHFLDPLSIEKARELMRQAEDETYSPTSENNPFDYFKMQMPAFSEPIELIKNFWNNFMNSNVRQNYNYIKHKGKPIYDEIIKPQHLKIGTIYFGDTEVPSHAIDVQKKLNLNDSITELVNFDNDILFPYLDKLVTLLREIVNPSQLTQL